MKTTDELIHDTVVELSPDQKPEAMAKIEGILRAVIKDGVSPKIAMGIDNKTMELMYDLAYRQYNSGHYKNALLLFVFMTAIDPKDVRYRIGSAACLHQEKEYKDAIEAYMICVPLDPKNPIPFYHISDCFLKLKDPFRAIYFLQLSIAQAKASQEKYGDLIPRAELEVKSIVNEIKNIPQFAHLDELLPVVALAQQEINNKAEARKHPITKGNKEKIKI